MSDPKRKQVIPPAVTPDLNSDKYTQQELEKLKRDQQKSKTPTVLLHEHCEKTESRLCREIDEARFTIEAKSNELRDYHARYAGLLERHQALTSQRNSSTICAGVGAVILGIASYCEPPYKLVLVGIGATASLASIWFDLGSWWKRTQPVDGHKTTH